MSLGVLNMALESYGPLYTFMLLFMLFWSLTAQVPIHFHYILNYALNIYLKCSWLKFGWSFFIGYMLLHLIKYTVAFFTASFEDVTYF